MNAPWNDAKTLVNFRFTRFGFAIYSAWQNDVAPASLRTARLRQASDRITARAFGRMAAMLENTSDPKDSSMRNFGIADRGIQLQVLCDASEVGCEAFAYVGVLSSSSLPHLSCSFPSQERHLLRWWPALDWSWPRQGWEEGFTALVGRNLQVVQALSVAPYRVGSECCTSGVERYPFTRRFQILFWRPESPNPWWSTLAKASKNRAKTNRIEAYFGNDSHDAMAQPSRIVSRQILRLASSAWVRSIAYPFQNLTQD